MTVHTSEEPGVKLGFRKIISGAVTAAAMWAFAKFVPGFDSLPEATIAALPAVVGTVVFYLVPEKVEVPYEESQQ